MIGAKGQHRYYGQKTAANWGLSTMYHCGTANVEQLNREFKMSFKKASVAAMLAVSMASTPVLAQSSAAPLSVAARSGADTGEASELRGGFIIPAIAVVAIILGILAAVGSSNDRPHSP
jgi:hypothetical protein